MFRLKFLLKKEEQDPYSKKKPPEKQREFYLEEGKYYTYIPKERLVFEDNKLLLYRSWGFTMKFLYQPKILIPFIGTSAIALGSILGNTSLMIVFVGGGAFTFGLLHALFACRIAKEIYLREDGKHIDVKYRLLNFANRTETHKITEFRDQRMTLLMYMWNLHPIPKNILAGIECEFNDIMPLYLKGKIGFYMLHGKPQIYHQDLLINVMNGIDVNTRAFKGKVVYFKERYVARDQA
ncbi:hypothetical protein SteCoe_36654 [Stentor coeruleus]|uniref:Uncharacterized protein n=1 Tax=Stentor coeruleus TaxID=5963 RepID=A0A1R2APS7_9CILI|nr:hypothetical protein SteCoe_36654 [Stentor coeruleus]